MPDPAVLALIRDYALRYGIDPNVAQRIVAAESSFNPQAAAKTSSAKGLYQMTRADWKDFGSGDVFDPAANAQAGARMTAANVAALKAAGFDPTPANIYLAHFAGPTGARRLLQANPSASVASVLSPEAVKANPFLANMTVADMQNWAARKMGAQEIAPMPLPQARPSGMPFDLATPTLGGGTMDAALNSAPAPVPPQPSNNAPLPLTPPDQSGASDLASLGGSADPLIAAFMRIQSQNNQGDLKPNVQMINYPSAPTAARVQALLRAMMMQKAGI